MKLFFIIMVALFTGWEFSYASDELSIRCSASWSQIMSVGHGMSIGEPFDISRQVPGVKRNERIPFGERTIIRWQDSGVFKSNRPDSAIKGGEEIVYQLSLQKVVKQTGGDGALSPESAHIGRITGTLEVRLQRKNANGSVQVLGMGTSKIELPASDSGEASSLAWNVELAQLAINQGADSNEINLLTRKILKSMDMTTENSSVVCSLKPYSDKIYP